MGQNSSSEAEETKVKPPPVKTTLAEPASAEDMKDPTANLFSAIRARDWSRIERILYSTLVSEDEKSEQGLFDVNASDEVTFCQLDFGPVMKPICS